MLLAAALVATSAAETGLRAAWHSNAVLAPSALGPAGLNCSGSVPSLSLNFTDSSQIASCAGAAQQRPTLELFSARFDATLTAPVAGSWEFRIITNGGVRFWVDDHIIIDSSCDLPAPPLGSAAGPPRDHPRPGPVCKQWDVPANHTAATFAGRDNVTHHIEKGLHLRLEWLHHGGGKWLILTILT